MHPTGIDWDLHLRCLLKAMIGAISPNFRMVKLSFENQKWLVSFVLAQSDESDLDEIDEIMFSYTQGVEDSLIDWPKFFEYQFSDFVKAKQDSSVTCSTEPISPEQSDQQLIVFKRKETIS